jgi:hypothetical protein
VEKALPPFMRNKVSVNSEGLHHRSGASTEAGRLMEGSEEKEKEDESLEQVV